MSGRRNVAVIGCGLMGRRRAEHVAADGRFVLRTVVDTDGDRARALADRHGCAAARDWRVAVDDDKVDVVIVSTPNAWLAEVSVAALEAGKHVLVEKPMGRCLAEAEAMVEAARVSGRVLKVGFNHRYHPAVQGLRHLVEAGDLGRIFGVHVRYGHGGRPGYGDEWRGDPRIAGGGELLDQGVHAIDLVLMVAGCPADAFAMVQTAVWPVSPLEDNAHVLLRYADGTVATIHSSWTQWRNLFRFEVFGERGSLTVEGLGGSYGVERLTRATRRLEGGAPRIDEQVFDGPDDSWSLEWSDFVAALDGAAPLSGTPVEGLRVMRVVDALYRSAAERCVVALS